MISKSILNKLHLDYLCADYEKMIVSMDATETLMKYLFNSNRGIFKLNPEQKAHLIEDINSLKELNLWEHHRETRIIEELLKKYEFNQKLHMLPEVQQKIYYDKLMEEVFKDV